MAAASFPYSPLGALHVVVVPTDFSGMAGRALPLALVLAERAGAEVHLVHVPGAGAHEAHEQEVRARLAATCMMYRYTLPGREPVAMRPVLLPSRPVGLAVGAYARQQGAGLVVMASHGHRPPSGGGWWSENAAHVVDEARCPVLLVPPGAAPRPASVCLPDPSAAGLHDRAWADALARGLSVPVVEGAGAAAVWVVPSLAAAADALASGPAGVLVVPAPRGDVAAGPVAAVASVPPGRSHATNRQRVRAGGGGV